MPEGCLIVSVIRDEKEFVPGGGTILESGDKLILLCDEYYVAEIEDKMDALCEYLEIPVPQIRPEVIEMENQILGQTREQLERRG